MVRKKSDTVIAPYPPDRLGVDKMHPGSPDCLVHTSAKKKNGKNVNCNLFTHEACRSSLELV